MKKYTSKLSERQICKASILCSTGLLVVALSIAWAMKYQIQTYSKITRSNLGIICYEIFQSISCWLLVRHCLNSKEYHEHLGG
jgi:hypothetical protein